MSSTTTSTSSRPATSASQAILLAEPGFLVGKYRVSACQVRPHPSQRLLCNKWVDTLHQKFEEVGIDRAAHPIKVLLEKSQDGDTLMQSLGGTNGEPVEELPNCMVVLVYHGQHRIAACQKMDDPGEHWWFAEVYRPGKFPDPS